MKRLLLGTVLAIGASGALAMPASADPTCSYVVAGSGTFSVALDATPASAKVTVTRDPANLNNLIAQNASGTTIACAGVPATVTNTGNIEVVDPMVGHSAIVALNLQNGALAPGSNVPPDASPEIDTRIDFGGLAGGNADQLIVDGTDNADNILAGESVAGELGINLNVGEAAPDADIVTITGAPEKANINGRKGDDTVSAIGAPAVLAMANPLTLEELVLEGGNQNDLLRGGIGNDKLLGGTQDDDLNGGGGNDALDGEQDNDSLDGGVGIDTMIGNTGTDFVTYAASTGTVNVSVDGAANDGGSPDSFADNVAVDVENVKGGSANDIITGSPLANELTGNGGADTLSGGAGNDKVSGSAGDDRVLGGVGNDGLFGGTERDNLVGASGNDRLTGNAGVDIFLGKKGLDRLTARDGTRDKKLNCGPGKNKGESVTRDRKDPKPKSC